MRKLFCEISPLTYKISMKKEEFLRSLSDLASAAKFSKTRGTALSELVYRHKSLIRRILGNVDIQLQENKAVNFSIAAPKINGVIIRPGEVFSFWHLVGAPTKSRGYLEGLTIKSGKPARDIGGGMCGLTNLLHWLALHSPLDIIEHHHHDGVDLFPDYGRQLPFGCGTSIMYNYLDYRLKNNTENTFQFIIFLTDTHLCGEIRALTPTPFTYHISEQNPHFAKEGDDYYRYNKIFRKIIHKYSGNTSDIQLIKENRAKVMYDCSFIDPSLIKV